MIPCWWSVYSIWQLKRNHTHIMFSMLRLINTEVPKTPVNVVSTGIRSLSMLARLTPPQDSKNRVRRVGRGPGSGLGKTSGRGQKGQKARGSVPNWFEGGQTPIWKLFPKRGFYRHQQLLLNEIKLSKVQQFYDQGKLDFIGENGVLDMAAMKKAGIVTGSMNDGVAILNDPLVEFTAPIKIQSTKASKPAIEAIEAAGGSFTSVYFSRGLGFRAHHSPTWFVENKGYVPIAARPIARRDIVYYSSEEHNGYLQDSEYVKNITIGGSRAKKVAKKTALDLEVEAAIKSESDAQKEKISASAQQSYTSSGILSLADLKL